MFKTNSIQIYSKLRHMCQSCRSRRRLSHISNKRITRIVSLDTEVTQSELNGSDGNERLVNAKLVNRNPRNAEQMLFEYKPLGFQLDSPQRHFWNKVIFETIGKHLSAKIVHNSGRLIVSASTKESAIGEQLKSASGVNAALSLGQILALRALESGIIQVFVGNEYESDKSLKVRAFLDALQQNGLVLEEQPFIFQRSRRDQ